MGGLNYITTILTMRTRGLSMMRLPLTQWSLLVTAIPPEDGMGRSIGRSRGCDRFRNLESEEVGAGS
jgi:hypothetical protein